MQFRCVWLLLLLIFPAAFAISAEPIDLTFLVPIMAMVVIIFLALMRMLSGVIGDPKLEAWVKTEIRELVAAIILIVVITAFFISSSGITLALTGKTMLWERPMT